MSEVLKTEWEDYTGDVRFRVKGLSVFHMPNIQKGLRPTRTYDFKLEKEVDTLSLCHDALESCVMNGLKGWEGIEDEEGEAVPFNLDQVHHLTPDQIEFVAYSVFNRSQLGSGARKKSSSQQTSTGTEKGMTVRDAKKGTVKKRRKPGTTNTK